MAAAKIPMLVIDFPEVVSDSRKLLGAAVVSRLLEGRRWTGGRLDRSLLLYVRESMHPSTQNPPFARQPVGRGLYGLKYVCNRVELCGLLRVVHEKVMLFVLPEPANNACWP